MLVSSLFRQLYIICLSSAFVKTEQWALLLCFYSAGLFWICAWSYNMSASTLPIHQPSVHRAYNHLQHFYEVNLPITKVLSHNFLLFLAVTANTKWFSQSKQRTAWEPAGAILASVEPILRAILPFLLRSFNLRIGAVIQRRTGGVTKEPISELTFISYRI